MGTIGGLATGTGHARRIVVVGLAMGTVVTGAVSSMGAILVVRQLFPFSCTTTGLRQRNSRRTTRSKSGTSKGTTPTTHLPRQ